MSLKIVEELCEKYDIYSLGKNIDLFIKKMFTKYSQNDEIMDISPNVVKAGAKGKINGKQLDISQKENVFIPDKTYVDYIIKEFNDIKNILPQNLQYKFGKDINEILEDDFDDSVEIMKSINAILNDCIMKSYTKVKTEDIEALDKFLKNIGYKEVEIGVNYMLKDYTKYFKRVFDELTDDSNYKGKIKSISIRPFEMSYYDEDLSEKIDLILLGECSYYK